MAKDDEKKGASSQLHAVIDRIEDGDVAVLLIGDEGETELDVPVALLPEGAKDGDHLRISISIDRRSRAEAEERIRRMQEELSQGSGTREKKDFKL